MTQSSQDVFLTLKARASEPDARKRVISRTEPSSSPIRGQKLTSNVDPFKNLVKASEQAGEHQLKRPTYR